MISASPGFPLPHVRSRAVGRSYDKSDRGIDLGNLTAFTAPDLSGNGLTATQYTGIYADLAASADYIDLGDVTSVGAVTQVRLMAQRGAAGQTTVYLGIDATNSVTETITDDDTWQSVTLSLGGNSPTKLQVNALNGTAQAHSLNYSNIELLDVSGTVLDEFPLFDSVGTYADGAPCISRGGLIGQYKGAVVGGSAEPDILQTAGEDFNKRMWLDGVSTQFVDFSSHTATFASKTRGKITGSFVTNNSAAIQRIFSASRTFLPSSDFGIIINNGNLQIVLRNITTFLLWTGSDILSDGLKHTFEFEVTATGNSIIIDGVDVTSSGSYFSGSSSTTAWFNDITGINFIAVGINEDSGGKELPFEGIIYNISVFDEDGTTKLAEWLGNDNTDAGWTDQAGINDGTVNGSPSQYCIPESLTAGTDALGNPLDFTRPNERVFNGAATDAYLHVADSVSRDSLNVFARWFYYDGSDVVLADYSDGAGTKVIEVASGLVVATDFAGSDVFVGNKTTEMANTNTVTAGWNYVFVPFTDYSPTTDTRFYGRGGHFIEYTEDKLIAIAERNRLATKESY